MIKKLKLKNFQGHEDSEIELGPGINSIVGENDSGKTSIFRAVKLIYSNRPLGSGYIRKNQPENCIVELENEKSTIVRERGSSVNTYRISDVSEPFTSFGVNPPKDILDVLNLSSTNIQSQLDTYFLVLDSPGQIAQHIRGIAGLDVVDKLSSWIKEKIHSSTQLLSDKNKELESKVSKLKLLELIDVNKLEACINQYEELVEENKEIESHASLLSKLINELEELERTRIKLPDNIETVLQEASNQLDKTVSSETAFCNLQTILSNLVKSECELISIPDNTVDLVKKSEEQLVLTEQSNTQYQTLLKWISDFEVSEKETIKLPENTKKILSEIEPVVNQYNNIRKQISDIQELINGLEQYAIDQQKEKIIVEQKQKELFELLDQITECPYCSSGLTDKTKTKLLESY
jgi:DNA repair exonuclease SbcCD ATPase subunit